MEQLTCVDRRRRLTWEAQPGMGVGRVAGRGGNAQAQRQDDRPVRRDQKAVLPSGPSCCQGVRMPGAN